MGFDDSYEMDLLTLKAPIMTAADNRREYFFNVFFRENKDLIFHLNPLLGRGLT